MSTISIEVNDSESGLSWFIELKRRITIIRGDSGVGKTELLRVLTNRPVGFKIKSTLPCVTVDDSNWESVFKGTTNSILLLDDLDFVDSWKFAKAIKDNQCNNNYYLIIGREQVGEYYKGNQNEQDFDKLSYSIYSILRLKVSEDGLKHFTEPFYKLKKFAVDEMHVDKVLTEDSGQGFTFFSNLLGDIVCHASSGKSSIVSDIKQYVAEGKHILIILDTAAYGCHMDELYNTVLRSSGNIYIDQDCVCFEFILLSTQMFKNNEDVQRILANPEEYANKYNSWETAFEELLTEVTKGSCIKYTHGGSKLRECWYLACDCDKANCSQQLRSKCSYYVRGNSSKLEYLLNGTKFDKYLKLKEVLW